MHLLVTIPILLFFFLFFSLLPLLFCSFRLLFYCHFHIFYIYPLPYDHGLFFLFFSSVYSIHCLLLPLFLFLFLINFPLSIFIHLYHSSFSFVFSLLFFLLCSVLFSPSVSYFSISLFPSSSFHIYLFLLFLTLHCFYFFLCSFLHFSVLCSLKIYIPHCIYSSSFPSFLLSPSIFISSCPPVFLLLLFSLSPSLPFPTILLLVLFYPLFSSFCLPPSIYCLFILPFLPVFPPPPSLPSLGLPHLSPPPPPPSTLKITPSSFSSFSFCSFYSFFSPCSLPSLPPTSPFPLPSYFFFCLHSLSF